MECGDASAKNIQQPKGNIDFDKMGFHSTQNSTFSSPPKKFHSTAHSSGSSTFPKIAYSTGLWGQQLHKAKSAADLEHGERQDR